MQSYQPRSAIAKIFYNKMHNEDIIQQIDMSSWYCMNELPQRYGTYYHHLNGPDAITMQWLEKSKRLSERFWLQIYHEIGRLVLNMFMTQTDVNGLLRRGSMFIMSEDHFEEFLCAGGFFHGRERSHALAVCDVGAGDGEVTLRLIHSLMKQFTKNIDVYVTESSWTMRNRLYEKNFVVLNHLHELRHADLIACFNVLDRCIDPHGMMQDIYESLNQTGFALFALVLPYSHYVEKNSSHLPLRALLEPHAPQRCATVQDELEMFFAVLESIGFKIRLWTKAPYLCEGDIHQSFYWLTDYIVLCSK